MLKELAMWAIVRNLVRLAMIEFAQRRQSATDRASFVDALLWLRWPRQFAPTDSRGGRAAGQARPASEKTTVEDLPTDDQTAFRLEAGLIEA